MSKIKIQNHKNTNRPLPTISDVRDYLEVVNTHGDKVAFRYLEGKNIIDVTYAEFVNRVMTMSAGLEAHGLSGKRIAVIGETSVEWFATYLAVLATSGVVIPMDKELAISEISAFLDSVEANAIVYSKTFNAPFSPYINEKKYRTYVPMVAEEGEVRENVIPLSTVMASGVEGLANGYELPKVKRYDELAEMLFTSGTTGTSKCVMLCQRNIFAVIASAVNTVPFEKTDTIVSVLPVHHTYELACTLAGMYIGMEIAINDSLRRVIRNFALFKPTGLVLVPLFVNTINKKIWSEAQKQGKTKLLKNAIKTSEGLRAVGIDMRKKLFTSVTSSFGGRLEKIICGGAKLNPELIETFEAFGISIYEGFGITECAPLTAVTPYYARRVGSIGTCVPCCRMRVEPNGQTTVDGYELGEIQVKGHNIMMGYYNNPEATAEVFTDDGWFRTGDIGYVDEDGYYYITGRSKFVIVLENGKNVFPEEIEEYLSNIEGVAETVVLGRKAENSDEVILTAIIYPDSAIYANGETTEDIQKDLTAKVTALNKTLPSFKQIKKVELRETEFVKTTSKKIKRNLVQ